MQPSKPEHSCSWPFSQSLSETLRYERYPIMDNIFTVEHLATFPEPKRRMEFARCGFGEVARKSICEDSDLQCKCLQASFFKHLLNTWQAFFSCPLIVKVQSSQGLPQCFLSFQSWFKTYVLDTMNLFISDLKIPSDSLSSHRPLQFISWPAGTSSAWYRRRIKAARHSLSANVSVLLVPLVLALSGHYVISILPQHLQYPDNNLGQFKIV